MTEPTCTIPMLWSLGEACTALCAKATATAREQRARFNWVMLVARPGQLAIDLARGYWLAVRDGVDCTDDLPPVLTWFDPAEASIVQAHGQTLRRRLNAERRAT